MWGWRRGRLTGKYKGQRKRRLVRQTERETGRREEGPLNTLGGFEGDGQSMGYADPGWSPAPKKSWGALEEASSLSFSETELRLHLCESALYVYTS